MILPSADNIFSDWRNDPERPVFLIDETRRAIFGKGDELILFTCVFLHGSTAVSLLKDIQAARTTDDSFKVVDLVRPEVQRDFAPLVDIWCSSLLLAEDVKFVATTAINQKKTKNIKAKLRMIFDGPSLDRPPTIEGRELNTVIHLILKTAVAHKIGSREVDVVLDRSDQMGMSQGKRRLPHGFFEVLGPGRLDVRPDGTQASLSSPALFRLIAGSDEGSFRDLLMLPELYGHQFLYGVADHATLYKSLSAELFRLLPFDIGNAKRNMVRQSTTKIKK